jgi:hypothetical protein
MSSNKKKSHESPHKKSHESPHKKSHEPLYENPYEKNPLFVAQIDPISGEYMAAYFFLGAVPNEVLKAANNAIIKESDPRISTWNSKDSATLAAYYGKGWKQLLTAKNPTMNESLAKNSMPLFFSYTGGKAKKNVDTDDIDDIDDIDAPVNIDDKVNNLKIDDDLNETSDDLAAFETNDDFAELDAEEDNEDINIKLFDDSETKSFSDYKTNIIKKIKATKYLPISVFPEDTIHDIKLKIHIATGIEFYRQHLFYYINDEGPSVSYQFNVDNIPIYINYKDLYKKDNILCGLHIDFHTSQRKEGIQIQALDTFITLHIANGVRVSALYFIDLFNVISPLDYSHRTADNLARIIKDKYEFDILYYGAIIKYWPQLSIDILSTALTHPNKMGMYLELAHDINKLKNQIEIVSNISNMAIKNNINMAKNNLAITGATIKVFSKSANIRCLIRNIFDYIETNKKLIMVNSKFNIESALLSESGINLVTTDERQGEFISITGLKRYATSQDPKYHILVEWFLNNRVENNTIMIAILRKNQNWQSPFIYITLFADGSYNVAGEWLEDNKIGFNEVIQELSSEVESIITNINDMGAAAFPLGGEYHIISDLDTDLIFGSITGSVFYNKYCSDNIFKEMKKKIKKLESSNILKYKNSQNDEIIVFSFLKGIIAYDLKLAMRAESGHIKAADSASNQYAWLYNSIVYKRWHTSFSGRLVRIYHRATDIKIEVINASNIDEFNMIISYVFAIIDNIYKEYKTAAVTEPKAKNRLKKLQENDPNLFDLKKYNPSNKVYSVLCQSNRQPLAYKEEEIKKMSEAQKKRMIKYWNFTENKPAYFECPHPKFPHLSFRPDQHPMGYCLPCCNMALPPVGSKTMNVYKHCLEHKKGNIDKVEDISKHVLTYGKMILPGRVSEIGKEIINELFLSVFDTKDNNLLYLIGVEQYLPSINNAGFTFSILFLIKDKNQTIKNKIDELVLHVRNMKDNFYLLGGGAGLLYKSSNELADDIINILIHRKELIDILDKSGNILKQWELILLDLIKILYHLNVVLFVESDNGAFELEILGEFIPNNDIIMLLRNNNGTFPIILTNIKSYFKSLNTTSLFIEDVCSRAFNIKTHAKIYNIIIDAIGSISHSDDIYDLMHIEEICHKTKYKIISLLINIKNNCYGVIILSPSNIKFYFPIYESNYLQYSKYDKIYKNISKKYIPTLETLISFIDQINIYFPEYIKYHFNIVNKQNKFIGFKAYNDLCYMHEESDIAASATDSAAAASIIFPYSILDINNEIINYIQNPIMDDKIMYKYNKSLLKNRLYKFFLAEFSFIVRMDRNKTIRNKLASIISKTKFDESNSLATLRIALIDELCDYNNDLLSIKDIISKTIKINIVNPIKLIINKIDSTFFDFDKQLLFKLKKMDTLDLIDELKILLQDSIIIGNSATAIPIGVECSATNSNDDITYDDIANDDSTYDDITNSNSNNIFTSCKSKSTLQKKQCKNNRLIIPKDIIDEFYHMLSADIKNPIKTNILASISSGVFDSMDFIIRENEILDIFIEN